MTNRYYRLIEIKDDVIVHTLREYDTFDEAKAGLDDMVNDCKQLFSVDARNNVLVDYEIRNQWGFEYYSCTISCIPGHPGYAGKFEKVEYIITVL